MKRTIEFCLICLFFFCCKRPLIKTGLEGNQLPLFKILAIDSITFYSSTDISEGKPVVLFYFSPRCPYCRAEMADLLEHMGELQRIRFLMISNYSLKEMRSFYKDYNLGNYANVSMGSDSDYFVSRYFKTQIVPYTAIYGRDMKLRGAYIGPVTSEEILSMLTK